MAKRNHLILLLTVFSFSSFVSLQAEPSKHQSSSPPSHFDDLHFVHPLFTESPFPDNKLRFDYLFTNNTGDEGENHTPTIEGEYRWNRNVSSEVKIPFTFSRPDDEDHERRLDNAEVAVKYANFYFEKQGVLFGGGLELGLPTGDDEVGIGSDHILEIEPFLSTGFKPNPSWEMVGRFAVGHTANENDSNPEDHEVAWNISALYHASPSIKPNLELFGERVTGGDEDGLFTANVAGGVNVIPFQDKNLKFGVSGAVPLSEDKESDAQILFSTFYHF